MIMMHNSLSVLWDKLEAMRQNQPDEIADILGEAQYALVVMWGKGSHAEACPATGSDMCMCCPIDPGGVACHP